MSPDEMKSKGRRFVDEVINRGKMEVIDELAAPDFQDHAAPPGVPAGLEGLKMFMNGFRAAFPDLRYHLEDQIAEGDKLVQRYTVHGTMKGEFQGMPATGKHAMWSEIHISRFANGKAAEHWASVDQLGMLQQLGLAPTPGQPAAGTEM